MEGYFSKKEFIKLGLLSGFSAGSTTYLMWLVINSIQPWDPYRSEILKSLAWTGGLKTFFYLLIFSTLLGFTMKYLQSRSRVILFTFVLIGLITTIIIYIFGDDNLIQFSIMTGFTLPLTIFYRGIALKQWFNWIKMVTLVIAIHIIYEFFKTNLFTDLGFRYFSLPIKAWFFTFLAFGPTLLVTVYIYHIKLGKFYHVDEEIGKMKLKEFLKLFYKSDIDYTFHKL